MSSNPCRSGGEFSSLELTLCADFYLVSIPPPCVIAVACKIPWSFCQRGRWQVIPKHAYTLDPTMSEWADYATVQAYFGNLSRKALIHNLSGNIQPQSSQLAELPCSDPGIKSGNSVCKLIFTSKKIIKKEKKCRGGGNEWLNIPSKSPQARKKPLLQNSE